ncbi:proline rich transmembrane protein 1B-like [Heteronotia binoei]|uniref:proline rich transmembrane protein 1B-like n=1 Tax=Heteronotia binoei TaxID=13085 RepID=UPI00292EE2B6|nr:proline rich transmembrane protein 1B-like [Heteronotia binoei]
MEPPNYQEDAPSALNPPPYSEKEPFNQQPPPPEGLANSSMPTQYQPYYTPYSAVPSYDHVVQPLQHSVYVVPVQPPHAPDYMGYSIFTMLFCCLPLGIAALVYSIRTRDANRMGNGTEAQENSRTARIFAHCGLAVGIVLMKFVSIYLVFLRTKY